MNQEQWDELKRRHFKILERVSPASVSISHEQFSFLLAAEKALPKILAEREAAQRLREAVAICLNVGSPAMLRESLSTFDKESKND